MSDQIQTTERPALYAEFYRRSGRSIDGTDTRKWTLILTTSIDRAAGYVMAPLREEIPVSGKREARRIAAERGATCWNF